MSLNSSQISVGRFRHITQAAIALGLVAAAAAHAPLSAQVPVATIGGTVSRPDGARVAEASVEARDVATGYVTVTRTDQRGRYLLLGLPATGAVSLTVKRVGFEPAQVGPVGLLAASRQTLDIVLRPAAAPLPTVRTVGREDGAAVRMRGGATVVSRRLMESVPLNDRNVMGLATMSPLMGNQLGVAGQRWTSTDLRLDGAQLRNQLRAGEANAGPIAMPLDAVQALTVATTAFDGSLGRQGGGQVSVTTRAGTNIPEFSVMSAFRNAQLSAPQDFLGRTRDARPSQQLQSSVSWSGPLVRDRMHLVVAFERQHASDPLFTGDVSTPSAAMAAGIAADSLYRVLRILGQRYGMDTTVEQVGRLNRDPIAQALSARLDWQMSRTRRAAVRVTGSTWTSPLAGGVDQPLALRESRADVRSRELQVMASMVSQREHGLHDVQLVAGTSSRALLPVSPGVPRGFVQVRSLLPDGSMGNTTLQFGGNRLAPDDSREWQLEWIDRWTVHHGPVVWTLGMDHALTGTRTLIAEAQGGLFVFPSIGALEAQQPTRFTRTVPVGTSSPITQQQVLEAGGWTQAEWTLTPHWSVLAALRWDGTRFLTAAPEDPAVDAAFAVRTRRAPTDLTQWQPRIEWTWRSDGAARDVVRLGVGRFTAQLPYYLQHNQLLYTGRALQDIDVRGTGIPTPDFPAYRADATLVPGARMGAGISPALVNVVGAVRAPRTVKAAIDWTHRVRDGVIVTLGAHAQRMTDGYQYQDRNLPVSPAFRLAAEGGRAVWVPAASIVAGTGLTDVRNASRVVGYARVLSLESPAMAEQVGLTAALEARHADRAMTYVAYAWGRARDNSSFGCCLARTSTTFTPVVDDPRDLQQAWAASDADIRHRVVGALLARGPWGVQLALRYRGTSGRPFTLVVDGDLNGDEANGNDRAYLFDPSDPATPGDVAAAMRRVLANPANVARGYIAGHLGQVAGRNAVWTPWTHRADLRLSRVFGSPTALGAGRLEVLLDIFNVGNLLNPAWGAEPQLPPGISAQNPVVNRVALLRVVGFDPATLRYRYVVNEQAGVLPRGGDPYQIQLGVRLSR